MKIAVTYENGEIFQHFGHTETFKVYEVEDGRILGSEIIGSNGSGHGALAKLLNEQGIDVLICGGIGGGAQAALEERGIELCAGAEGDADQAVAAYLRGELHNTGANCDHHHGEDHSCGDHGCGDHDCGEHDCGQGCHGGKQGKNSGKRVRTHYRGTFNDGTQFDSSYDRGEPLEFICGAGQMIPGFDAAVADMDVGQVIDVHLSRGGLRRGEPGRHLHRGDRAGSRGRERFRGPAGLSAGFLRPALPGEDRRQGRQHHHL